MQNDKQIAIIGIGCLFPRSSNAREYWRLISHGEDGITEIPPTHWSIDDYYDPDPKKEDHTYCRRGGFLSPVTFDPSEFGIPPNVIEATDTSQLLGLVGAKMALEDAGYGNGKAFNREKTSVILGVTGTQELVIPLGARMGHPFWRKAMEAAGVDSQTMEDVIRRIGAFYVPWQENSFPGLLGNVVAGRICNRLDLGGTNCVVDAACASSLSAVHLSIMELLTGRSDMAITGGVDALNDIFMHMCFSKTFVLSETGDARPFSEDADGTILGEGVGMVVLKRLADAQKDGDRIYAVIKAIGSSSDGKSQSIYAPRAEGQARALRKAYSDAGVDPATVELIEAHGTGTRVGDAVEFEGLRTVFVEANAARQSTALGSVKSNIGHAKAAAGSAGLIKAALALYHKVLPPTIKIKNPDPKLRIADSPFYLNTMTRPWIKTNGHPRRSGVSAFGFGGSNFHVVLEEYDPQKNEVSWDGSLEIAAFSADSFESLKQNILDFGNLLDRGIAWREMAWHTAELRKTFSRTDPYRALIVIERPENVETLSSALIRESLHELDACQKEAVCFKPSLFFSGPSHPDKIAFLFPGQGSQYVNMGMDLACRFPQPLSVFTQANTQFHTAGNEYGKPLTDFVFPVPSHGADAKEAEDRLRSTDVAQPAIGAVSLALLKIFQEFGIYPDAVAGHSFGELTALCAAGWMEEEAFLRLAALRGKYMAACGNDKGAGTMLAVKAPLDEIENLIRVNKLDVVLANRNSPAQGVLSGSEAAIAQALEICRENKISATLLPVAAAFHSRLVEKAAIPFQKALDETTLTPTDIPVFANTTGKAYPRKAEEARKLLAQHILKPVDFVSEIENLYESGVRTFIEVGPKTVLTGLVKAILKGKSIHALAIDGSAGRRSGMADFAKSLCQLAALGYPVDLLKWEQTPVKPVEKRMKIALTGANFKPRVDPATSAPKIKAIAPSAKTADKPAIRLSPNDIDQTPVAPAPIRPTAPPAPPSVLAAAGPSSPFIRDALKVVQEGLASMRDIQARTAEAHQKFLETQTQAGKSLEAMMHNTRRLAESLAGGSIGAVAAPSEAAFTPSTFSPPSTLSTSSISSTPKQTPSFQAAPPPQPLVNRDKLVAVMLDVVSRLTGYPPDMLGLDMNIEADLGIDSIKRVEILSAFEEQMPNLPSISPENIGNLKTLGQIIDYLVVESPSAAAPPSPAASAPAVSTSIGADANKIRAVLLDVVSRLTGYPPDMLGLDMNIEADLGIDSIKRVEILSAFEEQMPNLPSISPENIGNLKTLGQIIDYLVAESPATAIAPVASTPSAPTAAKSTGADADKIKTVLLDVVSRLTGYPPDMLGLDMNIEADLGIDSIKRVEILSAFEEQMPNLPSISPENIGNLKTLGQIIDYLSIGGSPAAPEKKSTSDKPVAATETVIRAIVNVVESSPLPDVSISLPKGRKILIAGDASSGLGKALVNELKKRGIDTVASSLDALLKRKSISAAGLILLPDDEWLAQKGWEPYDTAFLKKAFETAARLAPSLIESGKANRAFFATISRMDGAFGFRKGCALNPLQGGLAGLAKTAAIEWPEVVCHAIDIDPAWKKNAEVARAIVNEIFTPGAVEVGLHAGKRNLLTLSSSSYPEGALALEPKDVVVITGGARGVTAACAQALASHAQPTLILLGRSPEPHDEPAWLKGVNDPAAMKQAIRTNEFGNAKVTPAQIERSFKTHMANLEIRETLARLQAAGSKAAYLSTDVRDELSLAAAIETIRTRFGPVKAIVHGAGVLEDRLITDKSPEQFATVFDTKVIGLKALLNATKNDPLKYVVLFSSIAARQGNKGQVDYAMANEVLNKTARQLQGQRPDCRVLSINWGPWDGGMVNSALKKEFQRRNIGLIPLQAGAEAMVHEMRGQADHPVEVVIGACLDGEIPPAGQAQPEPVVKDDAAPTANGELKLAFEKEIDLHSFPILRSHVLGGKPVVPMALMAEWFGHGALHANPGLVFHGLDDMRVVNGIKLEKEGKLIRLMAGKTVKNGSSFETSLELRGGKSEGRPMIHSTARAILCNRLATPPGFAVPEHLKSGVYGRSVEEVYREILFHGPALQGIRAISGMSETGMIAALQTAPKPKNWMQNLMRSAWIADPLILDSAFQMASLWCFEYTRMVSLPSFASSYRQYVGRFPATGVTAVMETAAVTAHKMTANFTFLDENGAVVAGLTGYEAVMDDTLNKAFKPGGIRVQPKG